MLPIILLDIGEGAQKYLSPIKYLLAIMSLSERSANNNLAQANQVIV